jgi:hypothetical protein
MYLHKVQKTSGKIINPLDRALRTKGNKRHPGIRRDKSWADNLLQMAERRHMAGLK